MSDAYRAEFEKMIIDLNSSVVFDHRAMEENLYFRSDSCGKTFLPAPPS